MKRLLLLIFCLASCYAVSAQTTITGVVLDEDNFPQIGAAVVVECLDSSQNQSATVDTQGRFNVVVNSTPTNIVVSYYKYKTSNVKIIE